MADLHVSKEALRADNPVPGFEIRMAELGDYTVAFESMPTGWPPPGAFDGLPHDACPVPHWGFLFRGRFKALLTDGRELIVSAGEAYYLPPGHSFESLEPCESLWFSPTGEMNDTFQIVAQNVARRINDGNNDE